MRLHWGAGAVGIALLGAVACSSGSGDDGASAGGKSETPAEWVTLARDLGGSRAAVDEHTVGPDNVDQLAPAWELSDVKGVSGTPIVADGVVYIGDWTGHLRALDAATGKTKWDDDLGTHYVGGAAAVDDQRVFVGTFEADVIALDRDTGKQLWKAPVGDFPLAVIFGSPIYVDGLVIAGVASAQEFSVGADATADFRGHVVALDAKTGKERWRYWTTPESAPDSPGVAVWSTVAIDEDRGHVYVTTGNSYGPEPSDHSDAVIALDIDTGEELWINQFTRGDTWTLASQTGPDADIGGTPNLFHVGKTDALGVGDKAGGYRALDRDTGKPLWETKLTEGGLQGGVLASAASHDGTVYVASNKASTAADLLALDDETGHIKWRTEVGASVTGPVSWANGIVYTGDDGGHIDAFDAETGKKLWTHEVPAPAAGGIAIVDGTVYAGYGWWLAAPPDDPKGGLIAFRLGGQAASSSGGGESAPVPGEDVYRSSCARCHGGSGQGASGPSMEGVADRLTEAEHLEVVRNGRAGMPAWKDSLSDAEIEAVVEYERKVLSKAD